MSIRWLGTLLIVFFSLSVVRAADKAEGVTVDKEKKTVTVACKIAPRKLESLKEIYPIEVIATTPTDGPLKGQKAHETVVIYDCKPSAVHKALEELGLKAGKPASPTAGKAEGPELKLWLEIPTADGKSTQKIAMEKSLVDKKTGKPIPTLHWLFTGSAVKKLDPDKDEMVYGADTTGTLIGIFPVTDETVIQTTLTMKDEPILKLETNKTLLPAEGTAVKLIIEPK